MNEIITILYKNKILSEIDIHFANFITELNGNNDMDISLAAGLVSSVSANGDICLDLSTTAERKLIANPVAGNNLVCPGLPEWRKKLTASRVVGRPGDFTPLILDDKDRLYIYRYWNYENRLATFIKDRIENDISKIDFSRLRSGLEKHFAPKQQRVNWQKIAALTAVLKRFSVISGGPGTGKTYLIAKILALIIEQDGVNGIRIFLSAPTGKAAARLKETIDIAKQSLDCHESVKSLIPSEAHTIHRLLKTIPYSPYFRYNTENFLPADVVVVDEASMVDLSLMSKLAQALSPASRLILVGDKDQLSSIEAGSVLGDICNRDNVRAYTDLFCRHVAELTGKVLNVSGKRRVPIPPKLTDSIVELQENYRFSIHSGIGGSAEAVKLGDIDALIKRLTDAADQSVEWEKDLPADVLAAAHKQTITQYYSAYLTASEPLKALELFNRFKILCAVRKGPFGVEVVNKRVEQLLGREGLIEISPYALWYTGRPVLITCNDYKLDLYNGDIGIAMADPGSDRNRLYVFFPGKSGGIRQFAPSRLPPHETVYAMTVHKSQGSEFEDVLFILPDTDSPVLTRELVYTGITRAKRHVSIWGNEHILRTAISRKIERISGLREALWS